MRYDYSFSTDHFGDLKINLPDEISVVADFLESDVQKDGEWWICEIEKVMNGIEGEKVVSGNSCTLHVKKVDTVVANKFSDAENTACILDTNVLLELITIWDRKISLTDEGMVMSNEIKTSVRLSPCFESLKAQRNEKRWYFSPEIDMVKKQK